VQVGSADALFERPSHTFVGNFIGSPGMNFLPAEVAGGALTVSGVRLPLARALPEGALKLGVRPEYVRLALPQSEGALPATVTKLQDVGTHMMLTAAVDGQVIKARLGADDKLPEVGETAWLQVLGTHTCFYKNEEIVA
jgi:glycerol transport system ATP-binding protein